MDGENNGSRPYEQMIWDLVFFPYFWVDTHIYFPSSLLDDCQQMGCCMVVGHSSLDGCQQIRWKSTNHRKDVKKIPALLNSVING